MSRRIFQDDRMPWSLFLPMTLAVVVGVLIADGVRYAIGEVFAARAVTDAARMSPSTVVPAAAVSSTRPAAASVEPTSSSTSAPADGAVATPPSPSPDVDAAARSASTAMPAVVSPPSTAAANGTVSSSPTVTAAAPTATASPDQIERLPGSIGARRDQQPRACINGTVALRDRNGWQQELSSDSPVRCEQSGP